MNAIKFIKDHGVDKARKIIENAPKWAMSINLNNGMYYQRCEHKKGDTFLYDIKRLVESVELVNHMGGIAEIKRKFRDNGSLHGNRLKQAIADYESIYSDNDMGDDSHIENHVSPNCKKFDERVK